MRALLVNPWIYDFAAYDLWSKPLGLITIGAYLRALGWEVDLLDCLDRLHPALPAHSPGDADRQFGCGRYHAELIAKPACFAHLPREYKRYGMPQATVEHIIGTVKPPDVILVTSGMTYWYPAYRDMIALLKKRFPKTPVILGGIYPNICYEHAKTHSGADHVYAGNALTDTLAFIGKAAGCSLSLTDTLDENPPFPAYDLYRSLSYITLRTSRGCPFRCTYCGWYLCDASYSRHDYGFVVDEILHFSEKLGVRDFAFYDDALLYDADDHFLRIVEGVMARRPAVRFHTPNGLHNRLLSRPIADAMKRANFIRPRLALETSCAELQAGTGAKTTNKEFAEAVHHLTSAGYRASDIGVYILMGLPRQTTAEVRASVDFAASYGVRVHLEEYSPIPGTPDYKNSGLAPDADPLMHNNSAFPLHSRARYEEFQKVKEYCRGLNAKNCQDK